ncbi:MAG TPA: ATP-binding protein, partial [Thermomicrobiales bacterium]|nr:ATP-binding protein [Thermomicrobiales bacterium]
RVRLAAIFGAITLASIVVTGVAVGHFARDAAHERETSRLTVAARTVAAEIAPLAGAGDARTRIATATARLASIVGADIAVVDPNGETYASVNGAGTAAGGETLVVAAPVPGNGGATVRLSEPIAAFDPFTPEFWRAALAATILAAFLAWIAGEFVAERIAAALADLRRHAGLVAAGRLGATVAPAATRELDDVGKAFNEMTRRLAAAMAERDRASGRLETMLANLSDGVVITDERGVVLRLNPAAARMFGLGVGVARRPLVEICRDHELAALLARALASPDAALLHDAVELVGSRRLLDATAQRLDAGGERIGLLVVRDVTELRRLEGVRRDFVANVSHELRTPLTTIRALVETLDAGAIDDPDVAGPFLRQIVGEIERLATLVDELLDLARLESGRLALDLRPVAPATTIERAANRLRPQIERAGLALEIRAPPALPPMLADPGRIEQVLLNLIHNAIKFTPPGGTIFVAAAVVEATIELSVADDGIGIAAADLPRLFERFYKVDRARHAGGTGLGLAIAKHIVETHGGSIRADSAPGHGATFTVSLPIAAGADAAGSARRGAPDAAASVFAEI